MFRYCEGGWDAAVAARSTKAVGGKAGQAEVAGVGSGDDDWGRRAKSLSARLGVRRFAIGIYSDENSLLSSIPA